MVADNCLGSNCGNVVHLSFIWIGIRKRSYKSLPCHPDRAMLYHLANVVSHKGAFWQEAGHLDSHCARRPELKPLDILTVFGTRPEAIKLAPVLKQLQSYPGKINVSVCATGQHREMLDQVLDLFDISPDFDLGLMQPNQSPSQVASLVLGTLDPLFEKMSPDWISLGHKSHQC